MSLFWENRISFRDFVAGLSREKLNCYNICNYFSRDINIFVSVNTFTDTIRKLTINLEEIFYFGNKKMPYLCGFWCFANTYVNSFGKGEAWYVAADADSDFYDDFLEKLVIRTNAAPILQGVIPDGIEMTTRETEKGCYYIYQNFGTTDLPIPMPEGELRTVYGNPSEKLLVYGLTIVYQKSDDCVKIIDKQKELSGRNHKSMVRYLCNRN